MSAPDFQITILEHRWVGDGPGFAASDLCSHGRLRIVIGGQVITDGAQDYGVSETALALLRTLERDHSPIQPVAESTPGHSRIVFHGCGTILMLGCPIGIDWCVEHLSDQRVRLSNVRRFDTTNERDAVDFPGVTVDVPALQYRATVVGFAQAAKQLFAGVQKRLDDDWDREQYGQFWREYEELLRRQG